MTFMDMGSFDDFLFLLDILSLIKINISVLLKVFEVKTKFVIKKNKISKILK